MDWNTIAVLNRGQHHNSGDLLEFMVLTVEEDPKKNSLIHLFGNTREGFSVHAAITGFKQYFWARKPACLHFTQLDELKKLWNSKLRSSEYGAEAITNITVHQKEPLMYYKLDNQCEEFLKIEMNTPADFNTVRRYLRGDSDVGGVELPMGQRLASLDLYEEEGLGYVAQFMREFGLVGFGWVKLPQYQINRSSPSSCTIDVVAEASNFTAFTPNDDKEKYGQIAPLRMFTFDIETLSLDAEKGALIQIGIHLKEMGSDGERMLLDAVLYTGETIPVEGCINAYYESERDLLLGFQQLVQACDYDISRSYNGRIFDWPFLFDRAEVLGLSREFSHLSRMRQIPATIKKKDSNGIKNKREYRDVDICGRVDFDICDIIRREYTLISYTLNNVSMHFLKQTKEDVHWTMISVLYHGSPKDRNRLARYCRKDALLPCLLDEKLSLALRYIEQARVCGVILQDLVRRGQQMKVLTQIAEMAKQDNVLLPIKQRLTPYTPEGKYEGGLVLEPVKGFHDTPLVCFDFSSLYPSEGEAHNICYSTLIRPEDVPKMNPEDIFTAPSGHSFVRAHVKEGILPRIWHKLLAARKVAKGDMFKCAEDAEKCRVNNDENGRKIALFNEGVQDARQRAIKLVANAMYGFTGVSLNIGGMLTCYEVSESITSCGRDDLRLIMKWTVKHYPEAKIMYGDSVTGDTPVIIRREGKVSIVRCDELDAGEWVNEAGKEVSRPTDLEIWTENGFSPIKRFIRHYTEKPIIRVTTGAGMVDVTPDHSLLLVNGEEISPCKISIGTELMHTTLPEFPSSEIETDLDLAYVLGTKTSLRSVPPRILGGSLEVVSSFIDGCKCGVTETKERLLGLEILRQRLGRGGFKNGKVTEIKVLHDCYQDYVYDFETENHHFHVGPGKIVVHNTDSIMVKPPNIDNVPDAMKWMHKVSQEINEDLYKNLQPMKLAPEKVMYPVEFQEKKKYCAGYYETSDTVPDKVLYRGTEVARRDNCALARNTLDACCKLIFLERKIPEALQTAKDSIERLYLNKVDLSELIVSKSLSKDIDEYNNAQCHTQLAKKMQARDPTTAPIVGDRIPYVMIGEGTKGGVVDLAEDPIYVLENEIPINVEYYIKNQLQKPLERLFIPIVGRKRTAEIFGGDHTLKRVKVMPKKSSGGIMGFVQMMKVCNECRMQYDPKQHNHPSLCPTCIEVHGPQVLLQKEKVYEDVKQQYDKEFSVCQKCQGDERDPVLCMARSCPQLYIRKGLEIRCNKALTDIEDMAKFIKK